MFSFFLLCVLLCPVLSCLFACACRYSLVSHIRSLVRVVVYVRVLCIRLCASLCICVSCLFVCARRYAYACLAFVPFARFVMHKRVLYVCLCVLLCIYVSCCVRLLMSLWTCASHSSPLRVSLCICVSFLFAC